MSQRDVSKRWTLKLDVDFQYTDGVPAEIVIATKGPYLDERERIEVMPVTEHEAVVAELHNQLYEYNISTSELKAENEKLIRKLEGQYKRNGKLDVENQRLKRVVEKLREQRNEWIEHIDLLMNTNRHQDRITNQDADLDAINQNKKDSK